MIGARYPVMIRRGLGQDTSGSTDVFSNIATSGSTDVFSNIATGFQTSLSDLTSSWGPGEWIVLAGGAFILFAVLFTAKSGISAISSARSRRKSRAARKKKLEEELASL